MAKHDEIPETGSDRLVYARFYVSAIASLLFNPRIALWSIRQSIGQIVLSLRGLARGPGPLRVVTARLPFEGTWRIHRGGVTPDTSHSWLLLGQRFAYDFVRDAAGGPAPSAGPFAAYPAFGATILAAADGTVIEARDGCRDYPHPGLGWIDWRAADPRGNFVTIRHDGGWISLSAHLRRDSLLVRPGQRVRRGEAIAACGNSGHSTEPHLHFQAQDRPSFAFSLSLPILFEEAARMPPGPEEPAVGGEGAPFLRTGQQVTASAEAGSPAVHADTMTVAPAGAAELATGLFSLAATVLGLLGVIRVLMGLLDLFR